MTVPPVSDLIVDVMAAADPVSQRIAASKLERLSPTDQNFAAAVDQTADAAAIRRRRPPAEALSVAGREAVDDGSGHATLVKGPSDDRAVYRKFESFVLQMFVESMLPKDSGEVFGKGMAGNVWRSMLAEQIGNEMAKGDGIGIAKQLAKSRVAAATDIPPAN